MRNIHQGRRATLIAASLAAATAFSGCGFGSAASGPEQTLRDYMAAVLDGDGKRACAMMTPAWRATFTRAVRRHGNGPDCATSIAQTFPPGFIRREDRALADSAPVRLLRRGDVSTGRGFTGSALEATYRLRRIDGEWRLDRIAI